jgi:hypothetical protein
MSSVDKEIISFIRKIKFRIHRNIIFNYIIWGIIIALCCGSLVSIAALLVPLYKVYVIAIKLTGAGVLIALAASLFRIPKDYKAAQIADSLGLKERAVTALELIEKEDNFSVLQKKDTLREFENLDYKGKLTFTINKKQVALFLIFILIIIGANFIPTKAKEKAEVKYKFNIMQEEKIADIEKIEKEIIKKSTLKEEEKRELLNNLSTLKQEIKDAKGVNDINNSLAKFQIKTDALKEKFNGDDINNLASGLSRNNYTNSLANAIEKGDKTAISQEIKNLPEALKNATEEEQKKVAQDFAETAKNTEDPELKNTLSEMAKKLAENNPEKLKELTNSLDNFNNSIQKNVEREFAKNELKSIQSDFMPEKNYANNTGENKPSDGSPGDNQPNGVQPGGTGQGQNPGEGEDPSKETENPDENNEPGEKPTEKPAEGGKTENNPGGTGEGLIKPGSGNDSEGESVYLPPPPDATSETPKSQDLDKVIGKYKEKAYENMNSYIIPEAMKDIIKSYFSSLEQ